jgi:hypothetical protein
VTFVSPDGVAWERQPNADAPFMVCHGNGVTVGTKWKGRLLRSSDAVEWTTIHKFEHHVEAVAFGERA